MHQLADHADGARGRTSRVRPVSLSLVGAAQPTRDTPPCRSHDPDLWFADRAPALDRAKELCRRCPLRAECLADALHRQEPWGVWGGEIVLRGVVVPRLPKRGRPSRADLLLRTRELAVS